MFFEPRHLFPILSGNISLGFIFGVLNYILIPFLSKEAGGVWQSGMAFFLGMGLAAVLNPLVGAISDVIEERLLLINLFLFLNALFCLIISTLKGTLTYISAAVFVCNTFLLSSLYSAFVADCSKGKRAQAFGLTIGVTTFSSFLASLLINRLYDVNPFGTFRAFSVLIFVFSVPLFTLKGMSQRKIFGRKAVGLKIFHFIFENKRLLPFFLAQAGGWFSIGGILPYITSFLREAIGITIGQASQWMGIFTLVAGGSSILCGLIARLANEKRLFLLTYLTLGFLLLFPPLSYKLKLGASFVLLPLAITNLVAGFFYALGPAILSSLVDDKLQGRAFGFNTVFITLAQALAVQSSGLLIACSNYQSPFFLGAGVALFSFFPLWFALKQKGGRV